MDRQDDGFSVGLIWDSLVLHVCFFVGPVWFRLPCTISAVLQGGCQWRVIHGGRRL